MQKFFFNEQNKISGLVSDLNSTLTKFNNRDFDASVSVQMLLNKTILVFKELGDALRESEVAVLLSEFLLTRKGLNTIRFEKQSGGRTELQHLITYKILQQMQMLLQQVLQKNQDKVIEVSSLIAQIVTAALQANIIHDTAIANYQSGKDAETFWNLFATDTSLLLAQKRALLIVSKYDCLIILDDLITHLQ
ncbi:MAG TPA: hypothetical protein PK191_07070 [Niabella sp.]|nr:hypothetical protein [Niabella sp.]HOZ96210.1 hypothetical protein [Niabella sp.]HQW13575.1 hypothetical protein [Niabella sp.]HQX18969.1 hypothetical protein [Niabella sp.]HQX40474.1 hypothetical protein [Niabella sp.]